MNNAAPSRPDNPVYSDICAFFDTIGLLKKAYLQALAATLPPLSMQYGEAVSKMENGFPLIDKQNMTVDAKPMKAFFLDLVNLIELRQPGIAQDIKAQVEQEGAFEALVHRALREEPFTDSAMLMFLLQQTINPLLQTHAAQLAGQAELKNWHHRYCPMCGDRPVMGLIEAQTGAKYVICSACDTRWQFERSRCFHCGASGNISYFIVEEDSRFRVEICAECKCYLKVIDQRRMDREVSALQAHLTTLHLDIIAREKGYTDSASACKPAGATNA